MEVKTLSQFKSKLQGGGARPDLFEVSIPAFPALLVETGHRVMTAKTEPSGSCVPPHNSQPPLLE